ncbi:MAG: hypothetical protein JXP34_19475 [Planctomycetes bacterium]|nr:hypothetical protein [Planctomycetota bacterium]
MPIVLAFLALSAEAGETAEAIAFLLRDNQQIIGVPLDEKIPIRTAFGDLVVPFADVREIRMGARLPSEAQETIHAWLESLRAGENLDEAREQAAAILAIGRGAARILRGAGAGLEGDAEAILQQVLDQLAPEPETYVGEDDEIVATRFTMRGEIQLARFRVSGILGQVEIPRDDLVRVKIEETVFRKTIKIGPQFLEQTNSFLDSKIQVRRGQRIEMEASGTITLDGNTCGPTGLSNSRWNSDNMGALMWRIGPSQPWKAIGTGFNGKTDMSGTIQFTIHAFEHQGVTGTFKVVFTTRKD